MTLRGEDLNIAWQCVCQASCYKSFCHPASCRVSESRMPYKSQYADNPGRVVAAIIAATATVAHPRLQMRGITRAATPCSSW